MKIEKDEFEIWVAHPVTQRFFEYLDRKAKEAEDRWWRASWIEGDTRPELLAACREMAKTLYAMAELEAEDLEPDDEPEWDTPD